MTTSWNQANFLWIGDRLSPVETLALKSYMATGWDVTLYTYGPVSNVPPDCRVLDGREILDDSLIFCDPQSGAPGVSYANFSDLFRWALLSTRGGWWFDMDMVSISPPRPLPHDAPMRFGSTWEHQWGQCAITCAMFSNGEVSLFGEALKRGLAIVRGGQPWDFPALGPHMLQGLLQEYRLESHVAPWWEFCPYPWRQIMTACSSNTREHLLNQLRVIKHSFEAALGKDVRPARLRRQTRAVHLHNEIWRRAGLTKSGPFSRQSFVGKQMLKHNIPEANVI